MMTRKNLRLWLAIGTALLFLAGPAMAFGGGRPSANDVPDQLPVPAGYVHRPVIEFFTGLSCPSCMGGPHPDMEKLWDENGYDPAQQFTYISFHELNGGGVDDLNNQDATDRMRFYQPGRSGTPDAEFDGGYIELGGVANTEAVSYASAKSAVGTCKDRYQTTIDPLHPLQSLRNGFKFVKLEVNQMFTGEGFAVMVKATYLGTSALVETKSLNGQLYVFMVEDNVTAFSKVNGKDELNHNVFRGYSFQAQAFSLKNGESKDFVTDWPIPTGEKVPIKPADINAIAVVYDSDDTSSENNNQGNRAGVPRAVQSATPLSTAYDSQNDIPRASAVKITSSGGKTTISATFDDINGIATAFAIYNTKAANATNWSVAQFNITGSECEGDVCLVYENASGTAIIAATTQDKLFLTLLLYDGNGTQGKQELSNMTASFGRTQASKAGIPGEAIAILGACVAVGAVFYMWKKKMLPIRKNQPN
jgi:hypothetical protein